MKTEHGTDDPKRFYKSAQSDKSKEILGAENNGEYIDSRNARPVSVRGNSGDSEKINGEKVLYSNSNLGPDYVCIGEMVVNGRLIECWASPTLDSAIRIDGQVMVQSPDLTFEVDFPLQFDINEGCAEGEFFLTDDNSAPLYFDVKDIIDNFNAGTQVYFTEFNTQQYQMNLATPIDKPVFIELISVGGGGGLPVGQYQYSVRYVNNDGDRTNFTSETPQIPVVQSVSALSSEYPYIKTRGSDPNLLAPTSFGIKIRFRVTNLLNYDSIEIRRRAWNAGTQVGFTPQDEIVGRLPIAEGEISIREFVDPADSNVQEIVPDDEVAQELFFIEKAKSIRYFDKRVVLMNYVTASKAFTPTFLDINGKVMFPVVENLGKAGHNDPYHHTYFKHYPSGERYGFSVSAYDGVGSKGFSVPIPGFENYQFPNRREEIVAASEEDVYSYNGASTAANIDSVVTKTFEVFDLEDAVDKDEICSFKNIMKQGSKRIGDVKQDCNNDPVLEGGELVNLGTGVKGPYAPYRPVGNTDSSVEGHNYRVNTEVRTGGSNEVAYKPKGFAPNYYAKGIMLSGVDNFPDWVKAFSVTRTKRAGRVIAQGLGMYSLLEADFNIVGNSGVARKERDKMWFFSPDIQQGLVGQSVLDDIQVNPNNYSVQFISPLGYFSELYNFKRVIPSNRDRVCDLMSYARVLKDSGTINPTESGVGVSDYVAYNKYRNSNAAGDGFFSGDDGNKEIGITNFQSITDGRGSYFEISFNGDIYNTANTGGTGSNDFDDAGLKDWAEPFYIINIIQNGANIVDQNIDSYQDTGAYVKIESIIGEGNGFSGQTFALVDERWEDVIPALDSSSVLASDDRTICLRDSLGNEQLYVNVTYKTAAEITTITTDIANNGFHILPNGKSVTGIFTHIISADQQSFTVNFSEVGFNTIPTGTTVIVKYDNDAPIRVFGGDHTIGESIFSPIDREADGGSAQSNIDAQFAFDAGFPFRNYFITPRHYIPDNTQSLDEIQDSRDFVSGNRVFGRLAYLRQLCMMFTVESRSSNHYAYNAANPNQFFPNTHYIIRPLEFSDTEFGNGATATYDDNKIYDQYEGDYGDEFFFWKFGGLRFLPQYNIDYAQEPLIEFFSKPDIGFTEENDFCTGVAYSLARAINQQDSPGLKTFLSTNVVHLSDDQGEIVYAWDGTSGKGDNLYAFCNRGICLILTNKSVLSDLNANELGVFKGDGFIQGEYWLDKKTGMPFEFWRTLAETSAGFRGQDGKVVKFETVFFANDKSVYRFSVTNNRPEDIGRDGYYSVLEPILGSTFQNFNGRVTSFYDEKHDFYGVQVTYLDGKNISQSLPVYSQLNTGWIGRYDYRFDQYLSRGNELFGLRDGETYELDKGFLINGSPIIYEIDQVTAGLDKFGDPKEKEFIKTNINSSNKPTRVEYYNEERTLLCFSDEPTYGPLFLKKYDGWQNQIPRQIVSANINRDRVQGRLLIYRIIHNLEEEFKVSSVITQHKFIK